MYTYVNYIHVCKVYTIYVYCMDISIKLTYCYYVLHTYQYTNMHNVYWTLNINIIYILHKISVCIQCKYTFYPIWI